MKSIESRNNPRFKNWKKLLTKKGRKEQGQFIIEGEHLAEEALASGWAIVDVIMSEDFQIPAEWPEKYPALFAEAFRIPTSLFQELTETMTPQGIVMVIKQKQRELDMSIIEQAQLFLLVDKIQDPGNLGTIIRTADAAGIDGIVLGKGTVDPYTGKVLRSTQGSIFHIPIYDLDLLSFIPQLTAKNWKIVGTSLQGSVDYRQLHVKNNDKIAVVIGNEGEGVGEELLSIIESKVKIPIWGQAESLNVAIATGILLYHIQAQVKE